MTVLSTSIPGVLLVEPVLHGDARGFFVERYHAGRYGQAGIAPGGFVQANHSRSRRGVLRGLHTQLRCPQGKLVECTAGVIYDVVLDLRTGSPTFGRWEGFTLDADRHRQLWVPPGLAHGFAVLSETADLMYQCTTLYDPTDEGGVAWDDPELGIDWPLADPTISDKDRALPRLRDLADLPDAPFETTPAAEALP